MFTSSRGGFRVPFVEAYSRKRENKLRNMKDETKGRNKSWQEAPAINRRDTTHPRRRRQISSPQPTLVHEQGISEWDNGKSEFFSNLGEFNGNFRLLLQVEMSSDYFSKFHIIFNKSALLLPLNWEAGYASLSFSVPSASFAVFWNPHLWRTCLCREKEKERMWNGPHTVASELSNPVCRPGTMPPANIGVAIWFDRELPGVGRTSLTWPEEYIPRNIVDTRGERLCKTVSSKCSLLGEHHLVNKNIVWESALCKTLCNNPFCGNGNL